MKEQMDNFHRRQREEVEAVRRSQREDLEALWLSWKDEMAGVANRLAEIAPVFFGSQVQGSDRQHESTEHRPNDHYGVSPCDRGSDDQPSTSGGLLPSMSSARSLEEGLPAETIALAGREHNGLRYKGVS